MPTTYHAPLNFVESTVAGGGVDDDDTSLTVATGDGAKFGSTFPILVTVWDKVQYGRPLLDQNREIMQVTGRTGDVLAVARAREGTTAAAHAAGQTVAVLVTAGAVQELQTGKAESDHTHAQLHDRAHTILSTADHSDAGTYFDQALKAASAPQFARLGLGAAADADMLLYCYPQSLAGTPMVERLGAGVTNAIGTVARFVYKTDGDMADGFGPGLAMYIQDDAGVRNVVGAVAVIRDGADNSGKLILRVYKAGSASNAVTIDKDGLATFAGAVQVNGNTTLGDASTDTITATGRFVPRLCGSDPQHATAGSRPAGTVGEIARYGTKLYICTNASTPTWELFTSA